MNIIERLRIESRREPHESIWRDAIDEIEALRAEVERLAEALRRYGVHDQTCTAMDIPICTCGFDAALEQENSND